MWVKLDIVDVKRNEILFCPRVLGLFIQFESLRLACISSCSFLGLRAQFRQYPSSKRRGEVLSQSSVWQFPPLIGIPVRYFIILRCMLRNLNGVLVHSLPVLVDRPWHASRFPHTQTASSFCPTAEGYIDEVTLFSWFGTKFELRQTISCRFALTSYGFTIFLYPANAVYN